MAPLTTFAPLLLVGSLVLAGCGSSGTDSAANASTSVTTEASTGTSSAPGSTSVTGERSANTATAAEITAALTAAGVENGDAWADEVIEYRPYPADDPDLTKLRDELAKYDPPAGVIDRITGALEP